MARPPDPPTDRGGAWRVAGTVLVGTAAALQLLYGIAALAGLQALQDNVDQIESDLRFGELYFDLGTWGVLLVLAGLLEAGATVALVRRKPSARLVALLVLLPGLVVAFFTLALFRVAALVCLAVLLAALYVLSYRVGD